MYEFLPICALKASNKFENHEFLPAVFALADKYKRFLFDDYYSSDRITFMLEMVDLINSLYPHFYAIVKNGLFIGFVYLYDWHGGKGKHHSCAVTTCFERKFWGKHTLKAGKVFLKELFALYGLKKIRAEVFDINYRAQIFLQKLGFMPDGIRKNETMQGGRLINVLNFALFNDDYDLILKK